MACTREMACGFCMKAVEELELTGLSVQIETRVPTSERTVLMRGPLRKQRRTGGLGAPRLRLFELAPSALRWFDAARRAEERQLGEGKRKPKGSLRLYSSSSVEVTQLDSAVSVAPQLTIPASWS